MAHFKIVGGDFPKTTGIRTSSFSGDITLVVPKSLFKIDKYELKKNIVMLEQITEENKHRVLAKAGWSVLGTVALGPVGLLAGLFMGGKSKQICVAVKLKSGQEFIAECDTKTYSKLYAEFMATDKTGYNEIEENNVDENVIALPETSDKTSGLLEQLKELKDNGIITEEEYREKARKVLESI